MRYLTQKKKILLATILLTLCLVTYFTKYGERLRHSVGEKTIEILKRIQQSNAGGEIQTFHFPTTLAGEYNNSRISLEANKGAMIDTLVDMLKQTTDMQSRTISQNCLNIWNPCLPDNCTGHLSLDTEKRLSDILSPKLTLTSDERRQIEALSSDIPVSDVIFVSATSDNHYFETQAMVQSLHTVVYPRVHNMTFVLFDIGLTPEQVEKARKSCRCVVITFPFEKFPRFFKERGCYTWKTLIVMASMLKARKFVVYQDASISWKDTVVELLDRGQKLGLQLWGGNIMHNIPVATLKGMFDYMGDMPCAYLNYSQVQSGIIVLKQTPFIVRTIVEPWAKCGLVKDCFCPQTHHNSVDCTNPNRAIHMCHRFDQSALSIIVSKLFASERYRYHMPGTDGENGKYVIINRGQRNDKYFN